MKPPLKTTRRYERIRSTLLKVPRDPETIPIDPTAFTILQGDALAVLKTLPDESVDMCCTSPPYYGLRDYGVAGQIGLEETPEQYVSKLVAVFHEVKRVLKSTGSLWLNISDSYSGSSGGYKGDGTHCPPATVRLHRDRTNSKSQSAWKQQTSRGTETYHKFRRPGDVPPKNLLGIPWRVALALQADGWIVRNETVWEKPSVMPESVKDRLTRSHEKIFLLTKSSRYHFDGMKDRFGHNIRDVWTISTKPYKGAHFATFPIEIPETCIRAGCPVDGTVLDCFNGSGTSGIAAVLLGRSYIGIELNPEYITLAKRRLADALRKTVGGDVATALTTVYNSGMTTLETFQRYEESKAAVGKLQADLDAALTELEQLKSALRNELGIETAPAATTSRKRGTGAKRAPRSLASVIMTACGARLTKNKATGMKKAAALAAAIAQAEGIAKSRNETLTDETKAALTARTDEVFGAGKK